MFGILKNGLLIGLVFSCFSVFAFELGDYTVRLRRAKTQDEKVKIHKEAQKALADRIKKEANKKTFITLDILKGHLNTVDVNTFTAAKCTELKVRAKAASHGWHSEYVKTDGPLQWFYSYLDAFYGQRCPEEVL